MFRKFALSACTLFATTAAFAQTAVPPQRPTGTGTPSLPPVGMTPGRPIGSGTPTFPPTTATPMQSNGSGTSRLPPVTTTQTQPIFRVDDFSRIQSLNNRQLMQLNAMTQRLQQRYQAQYERLSMLPLAERSNRLTELNRDYANAWLNGVEGVLTPAQLANFQQSQTLTGGFSTFNDPAVQRGLNLTNRQIQQLNNALLTSNTDLQGIMRLAQTDPVSARQAYAAYVQAYENQLSSILTLQQQQQWMQMTGEPFPFPPPLGTGR
jgi:hypothetical protein